MVWGFELLVLVEGKWEPQPQSQPPIRGKLRSSCFPFGFPLTPQQQGFASSTNPAPPGRRVLRVSRVARIVRILRALPELLILVKARRNVGFQCSPSCAAGCFLFPPGHWASETMINPSLSILCSFGKGSPESQPTKKGCLVFPWPLGI